MKVKKLEQIAIVCSILEEIDRQRKGAFVDKEEIDVIVKAANRICEKFNNKLEQENGE